MPIVTKMKEMYRMHELIKRRGTGSRAAFAERLDVSESTIARNISMMKRLGAVIYFDEYRQSYYYPYETSWSIEFNVDRG
ncbi:MAG: HTH domain-containing protein [Bacteroidia bacterium]